jgi:hypothetical protein
MQWTARHEITLRRDEVVEILIAELKRRGIDLDGTSIVVLPRSTTWAAYDGLNITLHREVESES